MSMAKWYPRRLTAQQLEERRLAAGRWLRAGQLSQAEIARRAGVSEATVSRWQRRLREAGINGLRRRPHTGRRPRLKAAEWAQVEGLLADGAVAAGFDTERWTLRRIAAAVQHAVGVRYHPHSLGRVLHRHGWTPQRPATQAKERDEALIAAWLRRDWPRVKRGLVAAGQRLPSWTRRVTRFGPGSGPRGRPPGRRPC
jgi:putative transposase